MVLGKLPMLILIIVGQGPTALVVGAGRVVWTFFLSSITSLLSPSLWETAPYRLKYCLKGPLNPKQATNQPYITLAEDLFVNRFFHCAISLAASRFHLIQLN